MPWDFFSISILILNNKNYRVLRKTESSAYFLPFVMLVYVNNNIDIKSIQKKGRNDMRKTTIKKFLSVVLTSAIIVSALCLNISAAEVYNWYCKRTKDHSKPPLPEEFEFIGACGGHYIGLSDEKKIYLTFDAGYENGNVEKILDILKENETPAAFFVLSNLVSTNTDLVKRMANEGHLVCNHTSKHKDMSKINDREAFEKELKALEDIYKEKTGRELAKYFRPPEGKFTKQTLEFANNMGYKTVFWSFAYADWDNNSQMNESAAKTKILDNIHDGAVILLHPTSATNAAILGDVIKELKDRGYTFGTLDELVQSNIR